MPAAGWDQKFRFEKGHLADGLIYNYLKGDVDYTTDGSTTSTTSQGQKWYNEQLVLTGAMFGFESAIATALIGLACLLMM